MLQIGPHHIENPLILAPMAGVTDLPFRNLCRRLGAGLVVGEMVTSDSRLWNSRKSQFRLVHREESEPRAIQIAGSEPEQMADAAAKNVDLGAQIIDINMGCPAKKVCNKAAGSALMKDEALVADILAAVVGAVCVPVTLKIRTGWSSDQKNAVAIARIAEQSGIQALTVHGRTRTDKFNGEAEFDTVAEVKQRVSIPVIANGDITDGPKARQVLDYTGADGVMIGRAAQGNPWVFREINHFLNTGEVPEPPSLEEIRQTMLHHLNELHSFYGDYLGPRISRKHVGWYLKAQPNGSMAAKEFNRLEDLSSQVEYLSYFFNLLELAKEKAA